MYTDRRITDKVWSEKLTWAVSLKNHNGDFEINVKTGMGTSCGLCNRNFFGLSGRANILTQNRN